MPPRSLVVLSVVAACTSLPPPLPGDVLTANGKVVARLMHPDYDASAPAATCRPWHQVLGLDGRLLTKDLGGDFEHHRGLFLGWNRVECGARRFDFWHCNKGESQRVAGISTEANALAGSGGEQVVTIEWTGADGISVMREERRLSAQTLADAAYCLRVTSELRAIGDDVRLDGDAHHAGCHFRAVQTFAEKGADKLTYVLPGTAKGGEDDLWTDCEWIAAVLPFEKGPVTVLRVEGPSNPPATWSARPYGRFGAMGSATVTATRPLRLEWVYCVAAGVRDAAWCGATAAAAFPR
jgi:hypothetical protein